MELALGSLLDGDGGLLAHGGDDGNQNVGTSLPVLLNAITKFSLRDFDVALLASVGSDQDEEFVVNVRELVLGTADVGDVHVVGGGAELLELLLGKDVDSDQVDLGVTVLPGLGGAHLNNLAGTALDDDMPVLAQSRALHRIGRGGASTDGLEGVVVLLIIVSHFQRGVW